MNKTNELPLPSIKAGAEEQKLKWVRIRLIGIAFLYWMSLYLYVPTLPIYIQTKTTDLALVGTVLSMYGLWQLFARLPVGIASDWAGRRKPFIVFGLLFLGTGAMVLGKAPNIQMMAAGRAIVGVSASTWVPLLVLYGCQFNLKDLVRATAFLTAVGTFGRIIATSLTATLNTLGGYPLAFYAATATAVLASLLMMTIKEEKQVSKGMTLQKLGRLFLNREVIVPALLNALVQYVDYSTTFSFIPILAKTFGATDGVLSFLVSFSITIFLVGNLSATYLIRRWGLKQILTVSTSLMCTGVLIAGFAHALPVVFVTQFLVSLSAGIGYPVFMSLSVQNIQESERTSAMGLHQSVYSSGMFAGPWLSGILAAHFGISAMFISTAVFVLLFSLLALSNMRKP